MASDTIRAAVPRLERGDGDSGRDHVPVHVPDPDPDHYPEGDPDRGRERKAARPSSPGTAARAPSGAAAALASLALAAGAGALLQPAVPCSRCAAPFVGASLAVLHAAIAGALPARLRASLVAQEAFAAILAALAAVCALGTLVVQGQEAAFYPRAYGPALAAAILRLGLDDAFHSLWFAGVAGVFCGTIVLSAARRWPPTPGNLGFHVSHLGLLVALGGAAASSVLAVRGRIELRAGETRDGVALGAAHPSHASAARGRVPLGFALRLDRFDVDRWASGLRVGYFERGRDGWRLRASFEPEPGVVHRLPGGASFAVSALRSGPSTSAVVRLGKDRASEDVLLVEGAGGRLTPDGAGALALERRPEDVRAFRSRVTAIGPSGERSAAIEVNAPFSHGGWTFYQASWDPADPRYSALEAVRDPGAPWVFAGFGLLAAGVAHALFGAARLRRPHPG